VQEPCMAMADASSERSINLQQRRQSPPTPTWQPDAITDDHSFKSSMYHSSSQPSTSMGSLVPHCMTRLQSVHSTKTVIHPSHPILQHCVKPRSTRCIPHDCSRRACLGYRMLKLFDSWTLAIGCTKSIWTIVFTGIARHSTRLAQ